MSDFKLLSRRAVREEKFMLLTTLRVFAIFGILLANTVAVAAGCKKPDKTFNDFLEAFIHKSEFRLQRITKPLTFQETTENGHPVKALTLAELKSPNMSRLLIPMSNKQMELEDAKNDEKWSMRSSIIFNKETVTVSQDSHDADVWSHTYQFKRISGCWFLANLQIGGM